MNLSTPWKPTGAVRIRARWFGLMCREIEETREVCRRLPSDGYSPGHWSTLTRWRGERGFVVNSREGRKRVGWSAWERWRPTGNVRLRTTWFGIMRLEREEARLRVADCPAPMGYEETRRWVPDVYTLLSLAELEEAVANV